MNAFYTLDRELRVLSANATTLRLWGKSAREVTGRKLIDLFPELDGGDVHRALLDALRSLRPARLRTHSVTYAAPVDVEIYPLEEGLQVRYGPSVPVEA